jgi:hypothetical protein
MAQPNKYFITPDFDCPPNTAILLGHILTSPIQPYESLNTDSLAPPPPSITLTTAKTDFLATRSQLISGKFGIWAQIFECAYGAGVGHNFNNSQDIEFEIDEIETSFIKPSGKETKEYMRSCVEDEDVQAFFEGSRFKKSVYMIVGLKIAKGAKISSGAKKSEETTAKVMVDGTAGGVPVRVGPQVEVKRERRERVAWRDEKSFVFAYRLRKITCKRGIIVDDVEFNKGAFLDLKSSEGRKGSKDLHYLVEEDIGLEGNAGKKANEVEDGEELFIWPVK